jgi:GntR family transcriptional regulator, rspAB operon transcriptional repressor
MTEQSPMPRSSAAVPEAARILGTAPVGAQVYSLLRERIINMTLLPGQRISEAEIANSLETSRQPVREAFIKLSDDGLLEVRPQRGTYVRRISLQAVKDARFVREAIEADIVRLVAEQSDAALIADLRDQLAEQAAVGKDGTGAFIRLDERFHETLAKAAGKPFAWSVIRDIKFQMDRVRYLSAQQFPLGKLLDQHTAIVDAIAAGDADRSEADMRKHLREILTDLPEVDKQHPGYFDIE